MKMLLSTKITVDPRGPRLDNPLGSASYALPIPAPFPYPGHDNYGKSASWHRHQVQTVRWRLYQIAGKIVFHGGQVFLKVRRALCQLFTDIRLRIGEFATT